MKLWVIILTYNEEIHLDRCIRSIQALEPSIMVVDCYSSDKTLEIAHRHGANVVQHRWVNYATQFNWALTQLPSDADWVLRLDADEVLTQELVDQIRETLPGLDSNISGVYVGRRMTFQGCLIRYGGVFPVKVLRLFRNGRGECENRWMDEHIKVQGATLSFGSEIIDDNLQSLTWWTSKHNYYASREAVDLLNLEYGFMPQDTIAQLRGGKQAGIKRWLKERVYARLPIGFRAFGYFLYRYLIRGGFLDGKSGTAFHFLQGFWYRYLVDAKVLEVKRTMLQADCDIVDAIHRVLSINVIPTPRLNSEKTSYKSDERP